MQIPQKCVQYTSPNFWEAKDLLRNLQQIHERRVLAQNDADGVVA